MEKRVIKFISNEKGERLDTFIKKNLIEYSREYIKNLIKEGNVLVNGEVKKPSYKVKEKDFIEVIIPEPKELQLKPEELNIEILYEDYDIAIVNKPQGMLTHPTGKRKNGTLVNALLYHLKHLSQIGGVLRPGIVHRLDKDTSGLLVVAKNDFAHQVLSKDLKERKIKRIYYALVKGEVVDDEGKISIPLIKNFKSKKFVKPSSLGKEAETSFKVLERYKGYTLLEVSLKTGRTHQIRVHLSYVGYPIVGDKIYGVPVKELSGQLLHAKKLILNHPRTGERLEFESPLPEHFENFLKTLQKFSK
ncbi:MAG: RluA family pseudouridine synthase [Caldisericia bacterium]|nr:RluA family pseudouridine synthase [Caldisericia bacterium]